ncbi:MAG: rod-binding protein [Candidatus Velthaea sp.]
MDSSAIRATAAQAPLSGEQQEALKRLHAAAQQFEAVFVNMLFKSMRETAPPVSLTGKVSSGEKMFTEMLDEKRSEQIAHSGSFGIGRILEQQLKAAAANPAQAAKARVPREGDL